MADYYTSDVTQKPYSAIFNDASCPLPVRLLIVLRKAVGWHYAPSYARAAPGSWQPVEMATLPASARQGLESAVAEIEPHGFRFFNVTKSNTIGLQASYNCVLVADDRETVCTITALRSGLKTLSRSTFVASLRSDLADGTMVLTGCGPKLPSYFIRPHQKIELFPESTPISELALRHRERLRTIASQRVAMVPSEDIADYLLARAKRDWEDFMATGMFRKLSDQEIARLIDIQFDFE